MFKVKPDQYFYPPRSQDAVPRADTEMFKDFGFVAQLKYNDSHALVKYCVDGTIELWNRHAERFRTYTAPDYLLAELHEIGQRLGHKPGTVTILDGGLLDQKHRSIKNTIVVWDILVLNDEYLIGTTLDERYNKLFAQATLMPWTHKGHQFGLKFTENVFLPQNWTPDKWDACWDLVHLVNAPYTIGEPGDPNYEIKPLLEGLVYKQSSGVLELGLKEKNNSTWIMRSRVKTGRHDF
jgi:hypothetical protein